MVTYVEKRKRIAWRVSTALGHRFSSSWCFQAEEFVQVKEAEMSHGNCYACSSPLTPSTAFSSSPSSSRRPSVAYGTTGETRGGSSPGGQQRKAEQQKEEKREEDMIADDSNQKKDTEPEDNLQVSWRVVVFFWNSGSPHTVLHLLIGSSSLLLCLSCRHSLMVFGEGLESTPLRLVCLGRDRRASSLYTRWLLSPRLLVCV